MNLLTKHIGERFADTRDTFVMQPTTTKAPFMACWKHRLTLPS